MAFMKSMVLLACVAAALSRPQSVGQAVVSPIPILLDERIPVDLLGNYGFKIQTGNGISFQETASVLPSTDPAAAPVREIVGSYSFTHPNGTVHTVTYVAGAQGFVPQSDLIPTPHPLPAHAIEQIRFAEEQKRLAAQSGASA